jgi:hypothetical protein
LKGLHTGVRDRIDHTQKVCSGPIDITIEVVLRMPDGLFGKKSK